MQQQHLILYFTDGCHLCDDAVELLQQTIIPFKKVDIVYQQKLVDLYGYSIPVLQKQNGNTLNWPFDLQQIIDFSDNNSTN
jgi:hypothetical protein